MKNFFLKSDFFYDSNNIEDYIQLILSDMINGLKTKGKKSGQQMFRTFKLPVQKNPINENVIVIDAGGTNFRSCLVSFNSEGKANISNLEKTSMPAIKTELSKKDFFAQIANNISRLKNKSNKIAFCFSYAMEILENGDGKVLSLAKEVKAPEVVGCCVGKELKKELYKQGWNKIEKIVLLNDTVAALNAAAIFDCEKKYESYLGFILGTGMNVAYVEKELAQIIVCETGKCNTIPQSKIDIGFDLTTATPKDYIFEKMCSGGYLPALILYALKKAFEVGLISQSELPSSNFSMTDANYILQENIESNISKIIDKFFERSAVLSACAVAATVIKAVGNFTPEKPIGILCNGTTFYKTYKTKERFENVLDNVLRKKRNINFELLQIENDIILGTAATVF
ncbi:MAG: hexokinase [Treponema sp.]|nr:hexokinase [Treponema sp.]